MKRNREKSRHVFLLVSWAVLQIPAIAIDLGNHDKSPAKKTIQLPGNVALELMRIPAGIFQMGSPESERSRDSDEGPMHTVTIGHDFYMGKYEVTQAQWKAVMHDWMTTVSDNKMKISGSNPARHYGVGDQYPVYYISWEDCHAEMTITRPSASGAWTCTIDPCDLNAQQVAQALKTPVISTPIEVIRLTARTTRTSASQKEEGGL